MGCASPPRRADNANNKRVRVRARSQRPRAAAPAGCSLAAAASSPAPRSPALGTFVPRPASTARLAARLPRKPCIATETGRTGMISKDSRSANRPSCGTSNQSANPNYPPDPTNPFRASPSGRPGSACRRWCALVSRRRAGSVGVHRGHWGCAPWRSGRAAPRRDPPREMGQPLFAASGTEVTSVPERGTDVASVPRLWNGRDVRSPRGEVGPCPFALEQKCPGGTSTKARVPRGQS